MVLVASLLCGCSMLLPVHITAADAVLLRQPATGGSDGTGSTGTMRRTDADRQYPARGNWF